MLARPFRLLISTVGIALLAAAPAAAADWGPVHVLTGNGEVGFDLAMGADGTAALSYSEGGRWIRVAVKRPGHRWGTPVRVNDGRFGVWRTSVAVDGEGRVVVAWSQSGSRAGSRWGTKGPLTVRAAERSARGAWSAPRVLGRSRHFVDATPNVAANARGDVIVTWRGLRHIAGQRRSVDAVQSAYRPAGGRFGRAQSVREGGARVEIVAPVSAIDDRGTVYAAWTISSGPTVRLAARSRGAGGSWRLPRTLAAAPSSNPEIVVTADRAAIVAWHAAQLDSEGNGLQSGPLDVATRLPDGSVTAPQRITDTPTRSYRLAAAPGGETLLTWSPGEGEALPAPGELDLRWAVRPAAGGAFGAGQIAAGVQPVEFHGGPAALGDGTFLEAYGTSDDHVRVVARPPGGVFAASPELDVKGQYPLVVAAGRRAVAVWGVGVGERFSLVSAARGA